MDQWDQTDASALREFLSRPVGIKFLAELKQIIPKLNGVTLESRAISASEKEGGEIVERRISELRDFQGEPTAESLYLNVED